MLSKCHLQNKQSFKYWLHIRMSQTGRHILFACAYDVLANSVKGGIKSIFLSLLGYLYKSQFAVNKKDECRSEQQSSMNTWLSDENEAFIARGKILFVEWLFFHPSFSIDKRKEEGFFTFWIFESLLSPLWWLSHSHVVQKI